MALKADLRKEYLAKRRAMPAEEVNRLSEQIAEIFFSEFPIKAGETIHVFLPILQQREINTWPIIHCIWEKHPRVQVAVPVANGADLSLTHYLLDAKTKLIESAWGIPEPVNALPIPESEITKVLVPLVVCDLQGHRVGYGKGFYDRFMTLLPKSSQKIGLSLEPPIDLISDVKPWDLSLNAVITPDKVWRFEEDVKEKDE